MDLLPLLVDLGIGGLRERGDEITGLCAMHEARTGRADRHASWSINTETGAFQCFSCGWRGNLSHLYLDLTGSIPPDIHLMIQRAAIEAVSSQDVFNPTVPVGEDLVWEPAEYVPVPKSMLDMRDLDAESAAALGVMWEPEARCWFVPIVDEDGTLIGCQYKQAGVFLNVPADVEKSRCLFGLHEAMEYPTVGVVESPLDVVRLHGMGIPAVATFGSMVSDKQIDLLSRYFKRVVPMGDNDEAGKKMDEYLTRSLRNRNVGVLKFSYEGLGDAKDPGDVQDREEVKRAWKEAISPRLGHIRRRR